MTYGSRYSTIRAQPYRKGTFGRWWILHELGTDDRDFVFVRQCCVVEDVDMVVHAGLLGFLWRAEHRVSCSSICVLRKLQSSRLWNVWAGSGFKGWMGAYLRRRMCVASDWTSY